MTRQGIQNDQGANHASGFRHTGQVPQTSTSPG